VAEGTIEIGHAAPALLDDGYFVLQCPCHRSGRRFRAKTAAYCLPAHEQRTVSVQKRNRVHRVCASFPDSAGRVFLKKGVQVASDDPSVELAHYPRFRCIYGLRTQPTDSRLAN
jgi:hypothetical protein